VKKRSLAFIPLVLLLAGCGLVDDPAQVGGSLIDKVAIESSLGATADRLRAIDGVMSVDTRVDVAADYTYQVVLEAVADGLEETAAHEVVTIISEGLADDVFEKQQVWANVQTGERSFLSLTRFGLDPSDISRDVAYWFDVQEAVGGEASLVINSTDDREAGDPAASVTTPTDVRVDWDVLASIENDDESYWAVGALWGVGPFPSPDVGGYLDVVADALPPSDEVDYYEPYYASWREGRLYLDVNAREEFGEDPGGSPEFAAVVSALEKQAELGVPLAWIGFHASNSSTYSGGTVQLMDCAKPAVPAAGDERLLAALLSSGAVLPAGATAGSCGA